MISKFQHLNFIDIFQMIINLKNFSTLNNNCIKSSSSTSGNISTISTEEDKMIRLTSTTTNPKNNNNNNKYNKIKTPMTTWSLMMATFYFLLLFSCTTSTIFWSFAHAKPYAAMEFYRPYDHRSAMNTLKELDKYYSQMARPRFGKRASNNNNNFGDDNSAVDLQSQPQQQQQLQSSGEIIENGPYRWLLINRDQPLTKLTESYLLEILAENLARQTDLKRRNESKRSQQQQPEQPQQPSSQEKF
ncbi:uncharacterized protein LOC113791050 [Dermatophagoides pteronyssinus]|uniref:Integrator complex subunit 5-like protein n=1 Tax=Dermatophagoides pteronyssinus TaxID=6956 RepID=A0A6P6XT91_DERPT|nr:integrator complex subunit 5-like protein [Dermatophagoides pteronyssinus]